MEVLSFLCKIEKILNIHRDYLRTSRRQRVVLTFTILLQIILSVVYFYCSNIFRASFKGFPWQYRSTFVFDIFIVAITNSLITYFGPKLTEEFADLQKNLISCHELVFCCPAYNKLLPQLKRKALVFVSVFIIKSIMTICQLMIVYYKYSNMHMGTMTVYFLLKSVCEAQFGLEICIYCFLLADITAILTNLRDHIKKAADSGSLDEGLGVVATVYRQLLTTSHHLRTCFGLQVTMSLVLSVAQVMYSMCITVEIWISDGVFLFLIRPSAIGRLFTFSILLFTIAKDGQALRNEVLRLRQTLAKIRYHQSFTDSEPSTQKKLKDLQRLLAAKTLDMCLLPILPDGMSLLPAVMSLAVYHIIVILQLNHNI